eukprot:m.16532 g.16532  ORF g.16532 m.16532 type:complete len:91 (+) comp8101_c1_seq2:1030-1302(+)
MSCLSTNPSVKNASYSSGVKGPARTTTCITMTACCPAITADRSTALGSHIEDTVRSIQGQYKLQPTALHPNLECTGDAMPRPFDEVHRRP